MPGNRQLYDQAMDAGNTHYFDGEWDKASTAYARAIQEFPEDPDAHMGLGLCLLELKRFNDAMKIFERGSQLSPDSPAFRERQADVLERLGRLQEAAQQYIAVADVYLGQHDLEKAIGNWERATHLTPGLLQIHLKLAQAYERTGQKKRAIGQYLTLAFNFQRANDKAKALQAIERARRLEPNNVQVANADQAIRSGSLIVLPEMDEDEQDRQRQEINRAADERPKANPEGPLGEATEKALGDLAEYVFSDLSAATAHAIQGIEMQKVDECEEAVNAYKQAMTFGMQHASLFMCAGAMSLKLGEWQEAQKDLERAAKDETYAAGATHGLGLAFMGADQPGLAARQLITALKLVDTSLAMSSDEAAELNTVYDSLLKNSQNLQDANVTRMNEQFMKWLTGPDWKINIAENRRTLMDLIKGGEELGGGVNIEMAKMVRQIDTYMKQNLLRLAMDQAFRAIEIEPDYLPAHQRVAKILMEEGQTQASITKYNLIANSFLARNDTAGAAKVLDEVIKIAPMDVSLRTSLIELLEQQNDQPKMLEEYIGLGEAYYQLADTEQARTTFQEALRLAQRINAAPQKRVDILHKLADMDMSRLDHRQALRNYEQIRQLLPEDDRARRNIIDLQYRMNNQIEAVRELDGLLKLYAQNKRIDQMLSLLEQLVGNTPNDMALRSRLGALYKQMNRRQEAIAQLDALGELQLQASMFQEACATVKTIISMQPQNIQQYQNLLAQLGCG